MFIGIFFISGLSYHIYQSQSEESKLVAVTARDEVKELMLPDGTKVWLNKHTTLKYPREFSEKGRNVYMEGEAYFEVKRNTAKPFIVRSEAMQVRVLGTVFNLKSDKTNRSAVATLIKGEIEVKGNHEEGNEFWLSVYRDFNDVRLVFAPPSSVGKFGWDTDNWVWPRHTKWGSQFWV